jgi:predicted DCC family thiol-disulfide oxidoreductase YuxK
MRASAAPPRSVPILLYNGECAICRRIGAWVQRSAQPAAGTPALSVQPIGHDPAALQALHPGLSIWDAYKQLHLLMPDGTMKVDGEAVAEVLRRLPRTHWFAWSFAVGVGGLRPCQWVLNAGYFILADVRPLLGCESCGNTGFWAGPIGWTYKHLKTHWVRLGHPDRSPHFRPTIVRPPAAPSLPIR